MGAWLVIGSVFFLVQMYQPTRYFYLTAPAVVYFAAFTLVELAVRSEELQDRLAGAAVEARRLGVVLAGIVGFELFYVAGGWATNATTGLAEIESYFSDVPASATVLARPYLCVDIPQPCYSSAGHESGREALERRTREKDIEYVIAGAERTDWLATLGDQESVREVARCQLGVIYRVIEAGGEG